MRSLNRTTFKTTQRENEHLYLTFKLLKMISYFTLCVRKAHLICSFSILVHAHASGQPLSPLDTGTIQENRYVIVKDGHLSLNGARQRYWAAVGKVYARPDINEGDSQDEIKRKVEAARSSTHVILERLEEMGFNSVRMWDSFMEVDYTSGDGSKADCADYFIAEAKRRGFKIWAAGMNNTGGITFKDAGIIDDPETKEAWKTAVSEAIAKEDGTDSWELRNNIAVVWDPRLEALATGNKKKIATHYNHHTGLRWCDDPAFAVWELSNEEWWIRRMVGASWQKLPVFFRQSLFDKWHAFLLNKYGSQDALENAWGNLLPGENLNSGSILFAPMAKPTKVGIALNDANPHALEAVKAMQQSYNPEDFPQARASDVLEFLVQIQLKYKKKQGEAIKRLGKSTRLCPLIYDTGIGYEIQSQFLHQNADAVAHDAYVNGYGPPVDSLLKDLEGITNEREYRRLLLRSERLSSNEGHWMDWLRKPPGISQGEPWMEHNKVEGKPFLVYETQIQQPAKYRADFPLRIAALGSIQDWDWVTWHYWGDNSLDNAGITKNPFFKKLDVTTGGHPSGYHYTYDEVQTSLMRAAAYIFRHNSWKPAPDPTHFIYGKNSLYDPQSVNYGHSYGKKGNDMLQTVYQYGVRIRIDTTREDDQVIGPVVKFENRNQHNPYTPTDQVTFNWKEGYFKAVAPEAVAYAGRAKKGGKVALGSFSMDDITVFNPEGIYDPIDTANPYFAVSLYSVDGLPLKNSKKACISVSSTSFNTGFELLQVETYTVKSKGGELPVLTSRIGASFKVPSFKGGKYLMRDFNSQIIQEGKVGKKGEIALKSSQPVWYIELSKP